MDEFAPELEPAEAAAIFGTQIEQARGYFQALVRDGDLLGLLGPREMPKLWTDRGRCRLGSRFTRDPNGLGPAASPFHPDRTHGTPL